LRTTLAIVLGFLACVVLAVGARVLDAWMGAHPSPSPIALPLEAEGDRGLIVAGYIAPPLSDVNFGSGVEIHRFTPSWALEDATVFDDTLYVIEEAKGYGPHGYADPLLGILDNGHVLNVPLPQDYRWLTFIGGGVRAQRYNGGSGLITDLYALDGDRVRPISRPKPYEPIPQTLIDGDHCVAGSPKSGIAIYEVGRSSHRRPILSVDELKAATKGAIDQPYPVWCTHFHGEDFAFMNGRIGLIFRLYHGRASILTTGRFAAIGENDILIEDINYELLQAHVIEH